MNIDLHFFEVIDGQRRAVTLVVEQETRTILDKRIGDVVEPAINATTARDRDLIRRGVKFHKDASGRIFIDSVPQMEQDILTFFTERPCWFPGCDELRAQYNKEYEAIGGAECKNCDHGALIRKFQALVEDALTNGTAPGN